MQHHDVSQRKFYPCTPHFSIFFLGIAPLRASLLLCVAMVFLSPALALQPDERLADTTLERRAARLDAQLRCVICEAQSLASSEVPLAQDMRKLVRRRIMAGDSDAEILGFMATRYGDEILLKPPVQKNTLLLWAIPVLILGFMLGVAIRLMRLNRPGFAGIPDMMPPDEERTADYTNRMRRDRDKMPGDSDGGMQAGKMYAGDPRRDGRYPDI